MHCPCAFFLRDHREPAPPASAGTHVFRGLLGFTGYHVGRHLGDPRLRVPLRLLRLPTPETTKHPRHDVVLDELCVRAEADFKGVTHIGGYVLGKWPL